MKLSVRRPTTLVPDYNLTGDILSFSRCGLQYRFHGVGNLPASRPVQLWFGQFIHGVLEEAYRRHGEGTDVFEPEVVDELLDLVRRRLAAAGIFARNKQLEETGDHRARGAILELGPHLFPLIRQAEVRLTATRRIPGGGGDLPERYQMTGIVDVITNIELDADGNHGNPLVRAVADELPPVGGEYELIVDYKGSRRPSALDQKSYADLYEWQIQTYAELRSRQPGSLPVVAGVIVYLNELAPTWNDLRSLRLELEQGVADVLPAPGSSDEKLLLRKRRSSGDDYPELSFEYRLERALKIIPTKRKLVDRAAAEFDRTVKRIEQSRLAERAGGGITSSWEPDAGDEATCVACDFRRVCPAHSSLATPEAIFQPPAETSS